MRIRDYLYLVDPYAGFDPAAIKSAVVEGWCANVGELVAVVTEFKPRLMVEVGSWKGLSAVIFGKEIVKHREDGELVCVDTWLGSGEFQGRIPAGDIRDLKRLNGWPQVYFEFLANIVNQGLRDLVTPWPITSLIAARCLASIKVQADVVYIDASHDYGDVRDDLASWLPIVRVGGMLCGDDYDVQTDPGVVKAVDEFGGLLRRMGFENHVKIAGRMWQIRKTPKLCEAIDRALASPMEGQ